MNVIASFFEYLLTSLLMPMQTFYLLHCLNQKHKRSMFFFIILALWCVYIVLLIIAQFNPAFYYISPQVIFYQGPLHPLLIAPMSVMVILTMAKMIRERKKLSKRYFIALLIYQLPMTIAIIVHMNVYVPLFVDLSIVICSISMFAIILSDQVDRFMKQQQEIAHQRTDIMLLQMRPHFIYNTMMSIYYLCDQDAKKAQQVTLDFTTYLRKIFTAIASEDTIPFSEELEHTRAYLAVEQAQFEDMMFVEYNTPHTQFRVPPLTLQPIVENAVKHGMDPDGDPLRITVTTRKTDTFSEIVVENNGSDYEPADVDEPHTALKNIRQRLELMCGGRLTIMPRKGGGTTVKVTIPRGRDRNDSLDE